ncbi:restriction endonuclease subunit S [Pseudarthrobacter sp. N5]|uniref:restriction endonuclease subunit S n=1 Tax=Pseudarthrobacter sp. N5 TaxID=3418416 RepID=UPI003CECBB90
MTVDIELQRKSGTSSTMKLGRLGDHVEILSGFAFDSSRFAIDGEMPLIRIRDVVRGRTETYYSGPFGERFVVRKGDLLVGMDGDFNREIWSSEPALLNQRVCRISPLGADLDRRYLYHFLPQALMEIWHATPFATVKHLSVKAIREIALPLPPLDEQRRIAAILDKADELRTKRRQALAHLDALSTSTFQVLLARQDWPRRDFGDLCNRVTVGVVVKPASHYVSEGIPALRSLNVRPGGLVMENLVYFSANSHNGPLRKSQLWPGDIVTVRTGNAGTSAVVPANAGLLNAIDLIIATPTPGVMSPEYAVAFLNSDAGKRMVLGESRGQIQQHFNVKSLQGAVIPVPPIQAQHELASQLAQIDRVRRVQLSQLATFDALFASLQHRAFSGQL